MAKGTLSSIQSGSRKLLGKSNPVHALRVHDRLVYSDNSSIEGTVLKVLACTMTMLKVNDQKGTVLTDQSYKNVDNFKVT